MSTYKKSDALYPHPFSRAYWRDAALELRDTRMLVFAALMIAVRVAMKPLNIPLAPGLRINTAFLANALGAMVFGPVVAGLGAAVSDVLGFLIQQDGIFFPPLMLTEIAGSMIFALFLYRAKLTPMRVMLSRFCICFFVNVLLQTPLMMWYYALFMGGKPYVLTVPGILKNLFMFPIETVVLTLFLSVMLPLTNRLGLTRTGAGARDALRFSRRQAAALVLLFLIGTGCVGGYLTYYYQNTSLSASYTAEVRVEKNHEMEALVRASSPELDEYPLVTVVESEKKPFLGSRTTYTVAVYTGEGNEKQWGYSKSKAAADETLLRLATAVIVVDNRSGTVVSFTLTPAPPAGGAQPTSAPSAGA